MTTVSGPPAAGRRSAQLAYSELQAEMLDEQKRRAKAHKILAVLGHFLGRRDLAGLAVADVGCSAGFVADELARAGGRVLGLDIDVPGLARAHARFAGAVAFGCADGERLPLADGSLDVAVFNHIYEHVVDPDAVLAELHRVLAPEGVLYLGLGNRLGVLEPHYRLPFLSYLPPRLADRYVRATGRADHYHERFRTRAGLRRLLAGFAVWDYTYAVLDRPDLFAAADMLPPAAARRVPAWVWRAATPVIPTFVWVATKGSRSPAGAALRVPPVPLRRG